MKEMMPTISCEASSPPEQTSAIHPATLIQPVIQLKIGTHGFHAMTATQWYCPPAVGYADRNSASDAARHRLQTPAVTRPQMTEVGPPDGRARERDADSAVQELRMAKARPSIASGEKFRCSSALWPRAARASSSFGIAACSYGRSMSAVVAAAAAAAAMEVAAARLT